METVIDSSDCSPDAGDVTAALHNPNLPPGHGTACLSFPSLEPVQPSTACLHSFTPLQISNGNHTSSFWCCFYYSASTEGFSFGSLFAISINTFGTLAVIAGVVPGSWYLLPARCLLAFRPRTESGSRSKRINAAQTSASRSLLFSSLLSSFLSSCSSPGVLSPDQTSTFTLVLVPPSLYSRSRPPP